MVATLEDAFLNNKALTWDLGDKRVGGCLQGKE